KKTDIRLVNHLIAEQSNAILNVPDPSTRLGIRDRTMIHLAVTAGLRVSELVGLRLDEVSFQPRYVDIHVRGKGRKDRILSLWKEVSDSLHTWMAIRGSVQAPELFLNARGNRMTRAGFEYILAKHAEAACSVCPSLRRK